MKMHIWLRGNLNLGAKVVDVDFSTKTKPQQSIEIAGVLYQLGCGDMQPPQITGHFRAVLGLRAACSGIKERAVSCGSVDFARMADEFGILQIRAPKSFF